MSNIKYDSEWHRLYCKKWYEENRLRHLNYLKSKTQCECGLMVLRCSMFRHKKSKKHIKLIENKQIINHEDININIDPELTETTETVNL